ncbi:MAG: hypothetical protein HYZ72_08845 [Deltaproteobacteria bacterium]|nr:hypothetical protein [Deltaproteobacteria bacterium]
MKLIEVLPNGLQSSTEPPIGYIGQAHQAHFLAASDELVEALGKTAKSLEHPPQQVGHEGRHNLVLQGPFTSVQGLLDFEHGLDPSPPILPGKELARTPKDVSSSSPKNCS